MAEPRRRGWSCRGASEAVILALVCLAPWAFGSVEAWAELAIDLAIGLLAVLDLVASGRARGRGLLSEAPGLALLGLAVLALAQATPLPTGVSGVLAPGLAGGVAPAVSERIPGDPGPPVALPPPTATVAPEESRNAAARLAAAWVFFRCVRNAAGAHGAYRRFAVAVAGNAALLSLFSVAQSLSWGGQIYGFRVAPVADGWRTGGPFVGHNALAAALNLGLGLSLGLLAASRSAGARAAAVYAAGMAVTGIVASHSRCGFLAMLATGVGYALVIRRHGKRGWYGPAAVAVLAVVLLGLAGGATAYRRLASIVDPASLDDRLDVWSAALRAWADHPAWGTGLGTFAVGAAPYFRHDHGVVFGRAENEYLDVLLEGGVIGFGILLAGLSASFRLGWLGVREARSPGGRALAAGGLLALASLAVQSLGDFAPHVPGVGLAALALGAHLCASGSPGRPYEARALRPASAVAGLSAVVLCGVLVIHAFYLARAEARLAGSGVPQPGSAVPESISRDVPAASLERMRRALEGALHDRPDWAEGHMRLGLVRMSLYERKAGEWVGGSVSDPEIVAGLADPLRLHAVAHAEGSGPEVWLDHEPVQRHLVPAARCFLEARRCSPALASAHARLACLDFLFMPGDPGRDYAARAVRLAGADSATLALAARAASQAGHLGVAARAWRQELRVRDTNWERVAVASADAIAPDEILRSVIPSGARLPVWFADLLFPSDADGEARALFLREAIKRLPGDRTLSRAERLRLEARARAGLGDGDRPRELWESALALDPFRGDWRDEFAGWLADHGDIEAAHRQALIGVGVDPGHHGLRQTLKATAERIARGPDAR